MKQSRKDLLLELHNTTEFTELAERIEKEFPKLFNQKLDRPIKNEWVRNNLGCIFKWNGDITPHANYIGYGFTPNGTFIESSKVCGWDSTNGFTKVSDDEASALLINHANKLGFVKGAMVVSTIGYKSKIEDVDLDNYVTRMGKNELWLVGEDCNLLIFDDGKWAKIIETITKEEAEKQLGKVIID